MQCAESLLRERAPEECLAPSSTTAWGIPGHTLTCEIQSPVGRCHYSGAKVLSEQEKKKTVYESSLQGARQRADFMQDCDECALWTSSSSGVERD